ncbi:MAG: PhoU domain-containing protein [Gemmatimonadales bacterium]|jgi:phosphate uptake regulator
MLRELLSIFRSSKPLSEMGESFTQMLKLTHESTLEAGDMYFKMDTTPEARTRIYKQDVKVNKLERAVRRQVISHLSLAGNSASLPYCLLLMSLVKDVERIGDYAKNLAEVPELHPAPLPDDELVAELREIRKGVESAFAVTADVFQMSDRERAVELIREGRDLGHRCDVLVERVARSNYDAANATALALGTRYYKRVGAHVLNVLSSVVMPLHKLDYYDEDELEEEDKE